LFLYRYFSNVFHDDEEKSLDNMLELNSMFTEPLSEAKLINDTESASRYYKDVRYKYSNAKLISLLDITLEEHIEEII
ncbi:MAG: DNA-binding response regulator, partial [Clostridia bacterium]|nr:DNA-binding response regulator [Clostridia bacterium]